MLYIADLFCGAGGESTGICDAVDLLQENTRMIAINHWDVAIRTHSVNHNEIVHFNDDIETVDPTEAVKEIGGSDTLHLLWLSPSCTEHSVAAGGRPKNPQVRSHANEVFKWIDKKNVERIILENVKEFLQWGPLYKSGPKKDHPIPSRKGQYFRQFVEKLQAAGYNVEWRILNAADYGATTTRSRLFLQAVKKHLPLAWPEPTHYKEGATEESVWPAARDILDFSNTGTSIFERKKPLSENTLNRIRLGIRRFCGDLAEPFIAIMRGQSTVRSIDLPVPTLTSKQNMQLIQPFIHVFRKNSTGLSLDQPLATITAGGQHFSLIEPLIEAVDCSEDISKRIFNINGQTVKLDIRSRMLTPAELAAASSFPSDYVFEGNKTQIIKQIGNAVPPYMARALALASLSGDPDISKFIHKDAYDTVSAIAN
jgi:DNA (cytosine-5)-methyltransferase 1